MILSYGSFNHASQHHAAFANPALNLPAQPYRAVLETLSQPDVVYENGQRRGAPPRKGHELYCRWVGFAGQYVLVPVKILSAPQVVEGYHAPVGARLALTLFTDDTKPSRPIIWP